MHRYCAPLALTAVLAPTTALTAAFACTTVSVVIVPDVNPLEIHYLVRDSSGQTFLSGQYNSNSTVYCGIPGEQLTAVFSDRGGDGYEGLELYTRGSMSLVLVCSFLSQNVSPLVFPSLQVLLQVRRWLVLPAHRWQHGV